MFKIGLSREIKKDSFNCNLNGLLSFKSIEKLSNLAFWLSNNIWSKIADFLGVLTNLPVRCVILRCSEALTKNVCKTVKQTEKVGSNSSLYCVTKKVNFFEMKKNVKIIML